jgi:hypothetical protein
MKPQCLPADMLGNLAQMAIKTKLANSNKISA